MNMPKNKKIAAVIQGSAEETEAAFYQALQDGDIEKLMACWADEDDIICVHPGGPRLIGMRAIRLAFDTLFSNGTVRAWPQGVRKIEMLACSVHNVRERVEILTPDGPRHAYVVATNVYQKTAQGWRMVAHHASPGAEQESQEVSELLHTLH
jgi:ketosteroid isomerase-like protein